MYNAQKLDRYGPVHSFISLMTPKMTTLRIRWSCLILFLFLLLSGQSGANLFVDISVFLKKLSAVHLCFKHIFLFFFRNGILWFFNQSSKLFYWRFTCTKPEWWQLSTEISFCFRIKWWKWTWRYWQVVTIIYHLKTN